MYCPVCEEEVQAKREDINWAILVPLTIFTAGIGNLIYLSVWLKKPFDHCTQCNSMCHASKKVSNNSNASNHNNSGQVTEIVTKKSIKKNGGDKYCTNCGAELDTKAQYCAYCGSNL